MKETKTKIDLSKNQMHFRLSDGEFVFRFYPSMSMEWKKFFHSYLSRLDYEDEEEKERTIRFACRVADNAGFSFEEEFVSLSVFHRPTQIVLFFNHDAESHFSSFVKRQRPS